MASSYVNDLRLNEMATGDQSGTWGTTTNTNLELIAEAFGFGTEAITTNADTHTSTIADGATDPVRAHYVKYTGTLDSACTITIAPNTVNRFHIIENATSGSQNIIISQGSGANVTIAAGTAKAVYLDGAGSGAAVTDAFSHLSVVDLTVDDDLIVTDDITLKSDSAVLGFGADTDTTLTHTDGTGLTLNGTNKLTFGDTASFIHQSSDGVLTIDGEATIDLNASTAVLVSHDLKLDSDGAILGFGVDNDVTLTHVHNTGLSLNDNLTITTADNDPQLTLISTDTDASAGPRINMHRDSSSPADDDVIGLIAFQGENDASEVLDLSFIFAQNKDVTDGTEDSNMIFQTYSNGSALQRISIEPTETVFNEDSADVDFRVESDNNTNAFFVQGADGAIGLGRSTVAQSGYNNIAIGGALSTTGSMIELYDSDGNRDGKIYANAGSLYVSGENTNLFLNSTGTEGIKIESDSQTTISRSQEGPGNNHAFLTLSYHLSGSLGGFLMYTYSYYNDINFRIQNNDTYVGRNHNDMAFIRSGSTVGSVVIATGGTSFNTSSDYRLKEDQKSISDAIGTVKQLKPINFKWKKTGIRQDGFIAHEVDDILDYVVTGKKDAVKTHENVVLNKDGYMIADNITKEKFEQRLVDSDDEEASPKGETTYPEGSTWKESHEDIDPQVMDNAKLVPMLTAALQEAITKIETLETKVKALEEA